MSISVIYVLAFKVVVGPFYAHLAQRTGEEILGAEQDLDGAPMTAEIAGHLQLALAEKFHYRMKMSRDV